jgi:hypothetical protein
MGRGADVRPLAPSCWPNGATASGTGTYLAAQHARFTSRRGMARAQLAVGHSILVSATGCSPGTGRSPTRTSVRSGWPVANDEAYARRLVAQLERLGHTVVLDQPPTQLDKYWRTGFARPR